MKDAEELRVIARRGKLKMRYKGKRLEQEIARTREKLNMLVSIKLKAEQANG